MSRYRPPAPKSTPYITPGGFDALNKESRRLWVKRGEVLDALSAAAAEGDRSENAEYIYRKKQLGEVDRRIRYLQKRIPELKVVNQVADLSRVFFGAVVELETREGEARKYRIVGADEIDSNEDKGYISVDSPLAKALLKKRVGDEVVIDVGPRQTAYTVMAIEYETE